MKLTIKGYTFSISDEYIKGHKTKESFVDKQLRLYEWTKIEEEILTEKLGEIYDHVVPQKVKKSDK